MNNIFKNIFVLVTILNSLLFANNFEQQIENKKIYNSHIWKSLLHLNNNEPSIKSRNFLLSLDNFSLKNELLFNIKELKTNINYPCKFPARYKWLIKEFPELKKNKEPYCKDFNEYLEKTNANSIDLIFVSENIKNPSSMMGHIFFKINSIYNGKQRENAISFFTIINHLNIPLLAYESIIKGMDGYFILSPYQKHIYTYLNKEEKNVWEYKLDLTKEHQDLIYYHFWELKDIDITYYFTSFNCATIIDNMLGISSQDYYENKDIFWLTPKDVIKKANKYNLINSSNMIPSLEWSLHMIDENLDKENIKKLKKLIDNGDIKSIKDLLEKNDLSKLEVDFIINYTKYSFIKKESISFEIFRNIGNLSYKKNDEIIDFSNYKNPIYSQDSKQLSMGYLKKDNENFLNFNLLLAGNTIYDDNRNYFSENSLQIGNFNFLANESKIFINKIDFYEMKSYLPVNSILDDLSSEFGISYYSKFNNLYIDDSLLLKTGLGLSHKFKNDIFIYYLANFETYVDKTYIYPVLKPKIGVNVYEVFNMKSVFEYEYEYNLKIPNFSFHKIGINQSIDISKNNKVNFNYKIMKDKERDSEIYNFSYIYSF